MKTIHCQTIFLRLCYLFVGALLSCSGSTTYDEALNKNRNRIDDPGRLNDAVFLVEARSRNILQARLLELADSMGYSSSVVDLAKANVEPVKKFEKELQELAGEEKIKLPDEMSQLHRQMLDDAKNSTREEFDRKFIAVLKNINQQELKDFVLHATEAFDPDVRAFAARKVGHLRAYNERIVQVEEGLLTTVKE